MLNNQFFKNLDLLKEGLIYILIIFLFMDKGETLRIIGIYVPFFLLVLKHIVLKEKLVRLNNSILILFFLFCLSGIIASLFSPSFLYSLQWFKRTYLKLFLVGLVFLSFFNTQDKFFRLKYLFIIMTLIFIIFVYHDFYTNVLKYNTHEKYVRKYIYPLEIFLPFVFYPFFEQKSQFKYIGLLIILSFSAVAVILTGNRGGWISVCISLLICAYGYLYLRKVELRKLIVTICCVFAVITMLFIFSTPSHVKIKFEQLLSGYTSNRLEMVWPAAIESYLNLSLTNKIFGNGLGRITYLEDFKKWYLERFNKEPVEFFSPHNFYLSILYKQGIFGLLIFLSLVYICINKLIKIAKSSQLSINIRFFGICILASLIAILIHSFVEDTLLGQWILIIPLTIAYINYTENLLKNGENNLSCS